MAMRNWKRMPPPADLDRPRQHTSKGGKGKGKGKGGKGKGKGKDTGKNPPGVAELPRQRARAMTKGKGKDKGKTKTRLPAPTPVPLWQDKDSAAAWSDKVAAKGERGALKEYWTLKTCGKAVPVDSRCDGEVPSYELGHLLKHHFVAASSSSADSSSIAASSSSATVVAPAASSANATIAEEDDDAEDDDAGLSHSHAVLAHSLHKMQPLTPDECKRMCNHGADLLGRWCHVTPLLLPCSERTPSGHAAWPGPKRAGLGSNMLYGEEAYPMVGPRRMVGPHCDYARKSRLVLPKSFPRPAEKPRSTSAPAVDHSTSGPPLWATWLASRVDVAADARIDGVADNLMFHLARSGLTGFPI